MMLRAADTPSSYLARTFLGIRVDEFRYLWKNMSRPRFLAASLLPTLSKRDGDPRKAVLVIRQSLDDDAEGSPRSRSTEPGIIHLAQRPEKKLFV